MSEGRRGRNSASVGLELMNTKLWGHSLNLGRLTNSLDPDEPERCDRSTGLQVARRDGDDLQLGGDKSLPECKPFYPDRLRLQDAKKACSTILLTFEIKQLLMEPNPVGLMTQDGRQGSCSQE